MLHQVLYQHHVGPVCRTSCCIKSCTCTTLVLSPVHHASSSPVAAPRWTFLSYIMLHQVVYLHHVGPVSRTSCFIKPSTCTTFALSLSPVHHAASSPLREPRWYCLPYIMLHQVLYLHHVGPVFRTSCCIKSCTYTTLVLSCVHHAASSPVPAPHWFCLPCIMLHQVLYLHHVGPLPRTPCCIKSCTYTTLVLSLVHHAASSPVPTPRWSCPPYIMLHQVLSSVHHAASCPVPAPHWSCPPYIKLH